MEFTSGRFRGRTGRLCQFANDWMTVEIPGERPNTVVTPNQVKLNEEEIAQVRAANPAHLGTFWTEWEMYDDGTFVPRDHGRPITLGTGRPRRSGRRPRS